MKLCPSSPASSEFTVTWWVGLGHVRAFTTLMYGFWTGRLDQVGVEHTGYPGTPLSVCGLPSTIVRAAFLGFLCVGSRFKKASDLRDRKEGLRQIL